MSLEELAHQTELYLEHAITANVKADPAYANDCKYALGKLMIEGTHPDNVPLNMIKGINWIKDAANKKHGLADELKTYCDIRFEKVPSLKRIEASLM